MSCRWELVRKGNKLRMNFCCKKEYCEIRSIYGIGVDCGNV